MTSNNDTHRSSSMKDIIATILSIVKELETKIEEQELLLEQTNQPNKKENRVISKYYSTSQFLDECKDQFGREMGETLFYGFSGWLERIREKEKEYEEK